MEIVTISCIALVSVIIAVILKKHTPEYALLISIVAGVFIILSIISKVEPLVAEMNTLCSKAGISSEYITILLKTLGVCFLTQFVSDACTDAGEKGIASKVELAGKIIVLFIALPLFRQIIQTALSLIK